MRCKANETYESLHHEDEQFRSLYTAVFTYKRFQIDNMTEDLSRVSVQDVLNCSFSTWYPLFEKHSIKR